MFCFYWDILRYCYQKEIEFLIIGFLVLNTSHSVFVKSTVETLGQSVVTLKVTV